MPSIVEIKSKEELRVMHTGSLMYRRKKLLKCEESMSKSDRDSTYQVEAGTIEFKNTEEWKIAYSELNEELAKRGHWRGRR